MKLRNLRLLLPAFLMLALLTALIVKLQPAAAQNDDLTEQIQLSPTATFTVNSTNDPGNGTCDAIECTLREAITAANNSPGSDDITFNIAGAGPFTIQPVTELPAVTEVVNINGYSQTGSVQNSSCTGTATLQIVLNGALAGAGSNGLTLTSGSSTVQGLAINGFDGNGIEIMSGNNNIVRGSFIGTNVTGTAAVPNNTNGVQITGGTNNLIGSTSPEFRNIISGNAGRGIVVSGLGGANMTGIFGNYIGTSADGNSDVGNGSDGVDISQSANNQVGSNAATLGCNAGNLISGNNEDGVNIFGAGATGNTVRGNLIGTNAAGTAVLGNTAQGVYIFAGSNIIGGATADLRNIISGNGGGINIGGGANNLVQGNYIGTNLLGTAAVRRAPPGVPIDGIRIDTGANNNTIGIGGMTPSSGQANLISGNDVGVHIAGGDNNFVRGNFIGTGADGTTDVGNLEAGVYIHDVEAFGNQIGGVNTGEGNTIRFNGDGTLINTLAGEGGIVIYFGATGNPILRNSITENTGLGIDLDSSATPTIGADGVTPNDPNDVDSGDANNLQNYPVLATASTNTTNTTTTGTGTLNSTPNRTFRVEFFSDTAADPSGNGEGRTFVGAQNVTTNASGNAMFNFTTTTLVPNGNIVTATATDLTTSDTSEFSARQTVTSSTAEQPLGFEADVTPRSTGDGVVDATDVQQIERFSVGLDRPLLLNEGQRADCAPRATFGDGAIDATDVQVAENYSVGIGGRQPANGPTTAMLTSALNSESKTQRGIKQSPAAPRTLTVENTSGFVGNTVTVDISVEALGDEFGYTFSIDYESSKLMLTGVATGGIPGETITTNIDAMSNPNPDPLGLSVRFGGGAIPANGGAKQVLVRLTFQIIGGAGTDSPVLFTSNPANQATTSQGGTPLQTTYINGVVRILLRPTAATTSISGRVKDVSGAGIGGVSVAILNASSGETQTTLTNAEGVYRFEDLAVGVDYIITPRLARHSFTPSSKSVSLVEELTETDFTAFGKKTRRRL